MIDFLLTKTPLVFLTQSLWRDEAFSFLLARQDIWQIILSTAKDFSPPLYYLALHYWMLLFGSSEIAMRSLSLPFFYATIFMVDHFLIDILKIKTRWRPAYLLLIVINPFLVYYGYEARMYSMSAFFVTLSWYGLLTGKKKLHIAASVLGLYTHYFTALALFAQFIYLYLHKNHRSKIRSLTWAVILFVPWMVLTLLLHGSTDGSFWILKPISLIVTLTPAIILTGFEQSYHTYSAVLLGLAIFSYGAAIVTVRNVLLKNEEKDTSTYLLLWAFLPALILLLVSVIKPIFLPRYFIFSAVGMTLLLIHSLEQIKPILRAIVFVIIVVLLYGYNVTQITSRKKSDIRSLIHSISKNISANDSVFVENELDFHTAQYYFDSKRVYIYRKTYEEIPQYVGKVLIPSSRVVSTLPIYPKKAYIIRSNLTYDVQSMN